jgi:hypothetical protein
MVASVSAIFSVGYGLAALLASEAIGSIFGITYDTAAVYAGRLLGGSYVGYGIANFLSRDTIDPQVRRAVAAGNAFAWAVGFVVSTVAQLQGLANAIGWSTVAVAVAFTVAWAWAYASAGEREPATRGAPAR